MFSPTTVAGLICNLLVRRLDDILGMDDEECAVDCGLLCQMATAEAADLGWRALATSARVTGLARGFAAGFGVLPRGPGRKTCCLRATVARARLRRAFHNDLTGLCDHVCCRKPTNE